MRDSPLKVGDVVRYVPPNSDVGGPGISVAGILKRLDPNASYVVRSLDERPLVDYGEILVRLEDVENRTLMTMWGFMEIGYRASAFRLAS